MSERLTPPSLSLEQTAKSLSRGIPDFTSFVQNGRARQFHSAPSGYPPVIHVSNIHYLLPGPFRGCHETRPIEDLYAGSLSSQYASWLGCPAKRMQRSPHR